MSQFQPPTHLADTISLTSTVLTGLGGGSSPITHYQVEHLLTFTSENKLKNANKINSEVYQKVANLEKQNKLFIQDIIIHVDNISVKLLDHESFNTVESFAFKGWGLGETNNGKKFGTKFKIFIPKFFFSKSPSP